MTTEYFFPGDIRFVNYAKAAARTAQDIAKEKAAAAAAKKTSDLISTPKNPKKKHIQVLTAQTLSTARLSFLSCPFL